MTLFEKMPKRLQEAAVFTIRKRKVGKKVRTIAAPNYEMRELQRKLLEYLREEVGHYTPSAVENALMHKANTHFYLLDIKNAFPSITPERLARALHAQCTRKQIGGSVESTTTFLRRFCVLEGFGLAQGGPASQLLFDLYCEVEIDAKMRKLLQQIDVRGRPTVLYTRYVDDLTFSSSYEPIPETLKRKIRDIVRGAGFTINFEKTTAADRRRDKVVVTGVGLPEGERKEVTFTKEFLNKLERELERHIATSTEVPKGRLAGLIGYYHHAFSHGGMGRPRNRQTRRIDDKIEASRRFVVERPRQVVFPEPWLRELKKRLPLDTYIAARAKKFRYRKGEKAAVCLSPLRNENTPSFTINLERGYWHDFGTGQHGDVLDFAQEYNAALGNDLTFIQTTVLLARQAGLELPPEYTKLFVRPEPKQLELL